MSCIDLLKKIAITLSVFFNEFSVGERMKILCIMMGLGILSSEIVSICRRLITAFLIFLKNYDIIYIENQKKWRKYMRFLAVYAILCYIIAIAIAMVSIKIKDPYREGVTHAIAMIFAFAGHLLILVRLFDLIFN